MSTVSCPHQPCSAPVASLREPVHLRFALPLSPLPSISPSIIVFSPSHTPVLASSVLPEMGSSLSEKSQDDGWATGISASSWAQHCLFREGRGGAVSLRGCPRLTLIGGDSGSES